MKNKYFCGLDRIEFVVTYACTGRCRHCSLGEHSGGGHIPPQTAEKVIRAVASDYKITSVMTFGGEPLLFLDTVTAVHKTAADCGIRSRQIITNGFFGAEGDALAEAADALAQSGVNALLISVDAFHQEFIPLDKVYAFASAAKTAGIPDIKLHPAWISGMDADNHFNRRTRDCLAEFADLCLPVSDGNVVFPSGNAVKYLAEYFDRQPLDMSFRCGSAPYTDSLDDIRSLSITPDGSVWACGFAIGNVFTEDILDILGRYDPYANPAMSALMSGGVGRLADYAAEKGISVDIDGCFSPCEVCRRAVTALGRLGNA